MKTAQSSACAKLILFGEHAAVYGEPAIAIPLKKLRISVEIKPAIKTKIEASFLLPPEKKKFMKALKIAMTLLKIGKNGVCVKIKSNFPKKAGLGSSAALNVATVKALLLSNSKKLNNARICDVALEMERIYHDNPSGVDTTVSTCEKPIFFIRGKKPVLLKVKNLNLVVANSGKRIPTSKIVKAVGRKIKKNPQLMKAIREIGKISLKARISLENNKHETLGELMNLNHELLKKLEVSTKMLDLLVKESIQAGSMGAKLSGAGKGGVMVALCRKKDLEKVRVSLKRLTDDVFFA